MQTWRDIVIIYQKLRQSDPETPVCKVVWGYAKRQTSRALRAKVANFEQKMLATVVKMYTITIQQGRKC